MKKKTYIFIIAIWIGLWLNFITRDLYTHGALNDYKILIRRDEVGKRSYTYGDRFYGFLKSAKAEMPEGATYNFARIEDLSLESRRGIYYLYPHLKKEPAQYLLDYAGER